MSAHVHAPEAADQPRLDGAPGLPAWAAFLLALMGTAGVGAIDVASASEVHVVSLYFVPLMFAGWRLPRLAAAVVALAATTVWTSTLYFDGERYVHSLWAVNFVAQGLAFLTVAMLMVQLRERLRREAALRRTDSLTGLLNRQGLVEHAELTLPLCARHGRPVCLLFIDLDNFKTANDRFGHAYGDRLLRQFGRIVARSIRASDVAGRTGGDEFVVFLPETGREQAEEVCARITSAVAARRMFAAASVTASVGLAFDPAAGADIAELIAAADAAMYRDKARHRLALAAAAVDAAAGREPREMSDGRATGCSLDRPQPKRTPASALAS